MYAPFFGLKQEPFSIAPDPRYLFMSERHREALAHLLYGVRRRRRLRAADRRDRRRQDHGVPLLPRADPERCNVAYIFNPKLTVERAAARRSATSSTSPAAARGHRRRPTVKDYLDPLNAFLLTHPRGGQNNVLIIDEAQNLSADVLEQLRLLTNLETSERKLLQIVLIGQPELRDMLARPELEQLAQRVIARFHLGALTEAETAQYIRHRLAVAGMNGAAALRPPGRCSASTSCRAACRAASTCCATARCSGAYADGKAQVDRAIVDKAARRGVRQAPSARCVPSVPARGCAVVGLGGLVGGCSADRRRWRWHRRRPRGHRRAGAAQPGECGAAARDRGVGTGLRGGGRRLGRGRFCAPRRRRRRPRRCTRRPPT